MITLNVFSDTDYSGMALPGVGGFALGGVQIILSFEQFDGVQIARTTNFAAMFPDAFNEVYVTVGGGHLIDARQWTFTTWGAAALDEPGNHTYLQDSDGDDTVFGSSANDWVESLGGNDTIKTGAGNDFVGFFFGTGATTVNGGMGTDHIQLTLRDATANLTLRLSDGGGGRDIGNGATVSGFERLSFFSGSGNDRLTGGSFDDILQGNGGNDVLNGGAGNDSIDGGAGADQLTGGAGADVFHYFAVSKSCKASGIDRIDRVEADDVIDLSGIDAIAGAGEDAFAYIGAQAFSGKAGELRVVARDGKWIVSGDIDGDKVADLTISVTHTATLGELSFLL